jgi:hypothetical protein
MGTFTSKNAMPVQKTYNKSNVPTTFLEYNEDDLLHLCETPEHIISIVLCRDVMDMTTFNCSSFGHENESLVGNQNNME